MAVTGDFKFLDNDIRNYPKLMRTLDDYQNEFKRILKAEISSGDHIATGKMMNSIETEVVVNGQSLQVILKISDYSRYVEEGRSSGKWPPRDKIENWIVVKGITPRPDSSGKIPTIKSLAFLISRAIGQKGTIKKYGYQGSKMIAQTSEQVNRKYVPLIQNALQEDFDNMFSVQILKSIEEMIKF